MMTLPNFLVIGAAKCGTTSLYHYLRMHPSIFMSDEKEPHFFAWVGNPPKHQGPGDEEADARTIHDRRTYEALFDPVTTETALGEASIFYLYHPWVAECIHKSIPDARLIALLRNPIERAYSAFMHCVRDGRETTADFSEGLALEARRLHDNWEPLWGYKDAGLYHRQLERYYETFPRDQIRVYLYDDLEREPERMLRNIYQFLDVDDDFEGDLTTRHNVSGVTRSRFLTVLIKQPGSLKTVYQKIVPPDRRFKITERVKQWNIDKVGMPKAARQNLIAEFRDDILKLEGLIGRDLSHWLV